MSFKVKTKRILEADTASGTSVTVQLLSDRFIAIRFFGFNEETQRVSYRMHFVDTETYEAMRNMPPVQEIFDLDTEFFLATSEGEGNIE